jgi:cell division protein FtsL
MEGGQLMVVLIVAIVMVASIVKARYGHSRRVRHIEGPSAEEHAENLRLREEVKELKERLKVLERITVDKENSLSREIDSLRDR